MFPHFLLKLILSRTIQLLSTQTSKKVHRLFWSSSSMIIRKIKLHEISKNLLVIHLLMKDHQCIIHEPQPNLRLEFRPGQSSLFKLIENDITSGNVRWQRRPHCHFRSCTLTFNLKLETVTFKVHKYNGFNNVNE